MGLGKLNRSWKSYPFEVLNDLTEEGYISDSIRAKTVYFTAAGIEKVKELVKRYT